MLLVCIVVVGVVVVVCIVVVDDGGGGGGVCLFPWMLSFSFLFASLSFAIIHWPVSEQWPV